MNAKEVAWLAGIIEGEGSFVLHQKRYPQIQLGMSDEDVVKRAAKIFGVSAVYSYPPSLRGHKPQWRCFVNGKYAVAWMMMLYEFMGERRKAKIREILAFWKSYPAPDWHEVGKRSWATRQKRQLEGKNETAV